MLRTLLQQVPYLTPEDIAAFVPLWKKRVQLNRYDFLIRQGQVEQGLYIVTSGACASTSRCPTRKSACPNTFSLLP